MKKQSGITFNSMCWVGVLLISFVAAASGNLFASSKYPGYPFPFVSSLTPQAVVPGSGEFTLNVYGANFNTSSVVKWNREARQTTYISARHLQAQILATDVAQAKAGYITVTNTTPGGRLSTWASPSALVEVHTPAATISPGAPATYNVGYPPLVVGDIRGQNVLDIEGATFSHAYEEMFSWLNPGDGTLVTGPVSTHEYLGLGDAEFGDVNGDGNLDLVYTEGNYKYQLNPSAVGVSLGNGDGTFTPTGKFGNFADAPAQIVLGDFNRDGSLDVAVATGSDRFGVPIFSGSGDGTFQLSSSAQVPFFPFAMVTGDFNGDGVLDLVTESGALPDLVAIALEVGNGDGTFQPPRVIATIAPQIKDTGSVCVFGWPLVVADFNNDGKLDLAYCDDSSIGIMLGNGDGTFKPTVFYKVGYAGTFTFAVGDFNSDGNTDIIVSHENRGNNDHQFSILLGNGDGTFGPKTVIPLQGGYLSENPIVTGDFNSDGLLDFVLDPPFLPFALYLQQ